MSVSTAPHSHIYRGISEIKFSSHPQNGLSVTIDTPRLRIRSVRTTDIDHYTALYGDRIVIEKFASGQPKTRDEVAGLIHLWVKRWQANNPYAGLAIFIKGTGDFMGHIGLGCDKPGELELAGLGHQRFWKKGYASEAIMVIVKEYLPAAVKEGYTLKGKPLEKIIASARPDNTGSIRLLEKMDMHFVEAKEKFGAMRNYYEIEFSELLKKERISSPEVLGSHPITWILTYLLAPIHRMIYHVKQLYRHLCKAMQNLALRFS